MLSKAPPASEVHHDAPRRSRATPLGHALFGFDVRSMALYRIMLGLVMIGDILDRSHDLRAHYTDEGLFPRSQGSYWGGIFWANPYFISGHPFVVFLLFVVHGLIALSLSLGFYSRVSIVLAWFFQVGLVMRNIMVCHGGDNFFCCILFMSIFLPLGKVWSLDSMLQKRRELLPEKKHTYHLSTATVGYIAQVMYVYVYAYYLKTGEWWTTTYDATAYALKLEYFSSGMPFAYFLQSLPLWVLKVMTAAVLAWEGWGPLCYVSPILHGPLRMIGVCGFIALHLGFAMALRLGTFFWISATIPLALIPAWWWDTFTPAICAHFPSLHRLSISAQNRIRTYAELILLYLYRLGVVHPMLPRRGSKQRSKMQRAWKLIRAFVIAAIVVGALGWNLTSMDGKEKKDRWTDSILPWGSVLAMDQNWGMFAPSPPDSDQWFIIKCTSPSGKEFELFRNSGLFSWEGSEVSFDPPVPFHKPFYNHRWCKYWEAFMDWDYREIRPGFRAWLCREYNRRQTDPDNKISTFEVHMAYHQHHLNGTTTPLGSSLLYDTSCERRRPDEEDNVVESVSQYAEPPEYEWEKEDGENEGGEEGVKEGEEAQGEAEQAADAEQTENKGEENHDESVKQPQEQLEGNAAKEVAVGEPQAKQGANAGGNANEAEKKKNEGGEIAADK